MKTKLRQAVAVGTTLMFVGLLASCSNDSDSGRKRNSELGAVACVDAANSSASKDGTALLLGTCAEATKWAIANSDGTIGNKSDITNNSIELPIIGTGPVTVHTFNASDETVGIDIVKPNGSRNGIVYRVDTSGAKPVYYEAAPVGWGGTTTDPRTGDSGIQNLISTFNKASSPAADWVLGNEWEMRTILANADLARAVGISGGDWNTFYWTSKRNCSICALLIEKPAIAQFGYAATFAYGGRTNNYLRPIRSFTSGSEGAVAVAPTFTPTAPPTTVEETTTTVEETTTTVEAVTTTTVPDEIEMVADLVDPNVTTPTLPNQSVDISITPQIIDIWIDDATTEEVSSVQIVVDNNPPVEISKTETTQMEIPADAQVMTLNLTTTSGETVSVEKNIVRTAETTDTTTPDSTTTVAPTPDSTLAPASADDLEEPGVEVAGEGSQSESSSSSTIWLVIVGAALVVVVAGGVVQQRRKKK